ncbi:hypothetical protein O3P69_013892 [Scylla paramamosain]|uniref:Uncharacterized protein n=1 Tax=Scylla paramamosain TaxID=85552 RepID=A0AAW0STK0_SCYPA
MDSTRGCGCQLIYERQCRTGVGAVNSATRPHLDPELFPGPVPLTLCQARSADPTPPSFPVPRNLFFSNLDEVRRPSTPHNGHYAHASPRPAECGTAETCPSENHVGGCEKVLMTVAPITSACSVGDLSLAELKGAEECREGRTWCWSGSGNERVRSRRCRLAEGREPPAGWLCPSLQPQYLPDLLAELLARDKDRLACGGAWGGGGRGQTVEALVLPVLLTGRHARMCKGVPKGSLRGRGGRLTHPAPPKHAQHSRKPPVTHAAALTDAPVLG